MSLFMLKKLLSVFFSQLIKVLCRRSIWLFNVWISWSFFSMYSEAWLSFCIVCVRSSDKLFRTLFISSWEWDSTDLIRLFVASRALENFLYKIYSELIFMSWVSFSIVGRICWSLTSLNTFW